MAWFRKKQSPIDRRLDELNRQIADLESQSRKQQEEETKRRAGEALEPHKIDGQEQPTSRLHAKDARPQPAARPRFRTTVTPKGVAPIHGIEPHEVDFFARRDRPVDFSLEAGSAPATKPDGAKEESPGQASVRGHLSSILDSILQIFGKPKPRHPEERLVSYLTTGSFQRLKPLRYEKRIARYRLITIAVIVVVILFLVIKSIMR